MDNDRANCVDCDKEYDIEDMVVDSGTEDEYYTFVCEKCEFLRKDEEDV
jgi:hypothetical protein